MISVEPQQQFPLGSVHLWPGEAEPPSPPLGMLLTLSLPAVSPGLALNTRAQCVGSEAELRC